MAVSGWVGQELATLAGGYEEQIASLSRQLRQAQAEIADVTQEFEGQREDLLDSIRETSKENKLLLKILHKLVGKVDTDTIMSASRWNEDKEDWLLPKLDIKMALPKIALPSAHAADQAGGDGPYPDGARRPARSSKKHNYDGHTDQALEARAQALLAQPLSTSATQIAQSGSYGVLARNAYTAEKAAAYGGYPPQPPPRDGFVAGRPLASRARVGTAGGGSGGYRNMDELLNANDENAKQRLQQMEFMPVPSFGAPGGRTPNSGTRSPAEYGTPAADALTGGVACGRCFVVVCLCLCVVVWLFDAWLKPVRV